MGKNSRRKQQARALAQNGAQTTAKATPKLYDVPFVERPFAGLANEIELIALRELLPAATLELRTNAEFGDKKVTFVTLLPNQAQGMVREEDGAIMVALQTRSRTRDASHDLAVILKQLLDAAPGTVIDGAELRVEAPRLQDMLTSEPGYFAIHSDFGFWLAPEAERSEQVERAIAQSAEQLIPCNQIGDERGAYWTSMNKDFVRWIWDVDPERMFDALARLRVSGDCTLGEGSFFIGAFRAMGLLVPVWEFPQRVQPEALVDEVAAARQRIEAALADDSPLTYEQRRARAGLVSRQVSLA